MKTKTRNWLIAATCFVVLGIIIFSVVMSANGWDFSLLATEKMVTNTHELNEDFENISIDTETVDIVFKPSDTKQTMVVCFEEENSNHSVMVEDNTLKIGLNDERKWYEHIGIFSNTPKITLYLPKTEYGSLTVKESTGDIEIPKDFKFSGVDIKVSTGDVNLQSSATDLIKIKASTGDIKAENISAKMLDLSVSTGDIIAQNIFCKGNIKIGVSTGKAKLQNISCLNLISSGSTGDFSLQNVIAKGSFSIKRSTGNIKLDGCDAKELLIKTDTGDVKGTLLSDKVFIVESDTGSMNVPKTVTGGKCEITTDTGDIKIEIG